MNCIIIEDEDISVERLEQQLLQTGHQVQVQARLDSVKGAVSWLKENQTDLILLDIQLGDGIGFEIFDHVQLKTPVIFTTSYEHYMIRAFELNSISYLLKPVKLDDLKMALDKFVFLLPQVDSTNIRMLPLHTQFQKRFLVKTGHQFQSIAASDIAWFYIQNRRFLFIVTKDKQQFLYDSTLEILEQRIDPEVFFRINRQCIINLDIVQSFSMSDNKGRLKLETDPEAREELIVSISKAAEFRSKMDR